MIENAGELVGFIIESKRATYAGGGKHSTPWRPASNDLPYEKSPYLYIDTYLGGINFLGEEAVWRNGTPLWGVNYYGWMLSSDVPDGFSECLKGALFNPPLEAPYRGPASYVDGRFEYRCQWDGDLERCTGWESILLDGQEIYRLMFHGGQII
jgi:hypothetical protein